MNSSGVPIKLGVTNLLERERDILKDVRVGLIANSASVNEHGFATAALLIEDGIDVRCLLSPEHGYDILIEAGKTVSDDIETQTGLPIQSLYGKTRQPTREMVQDIDALVFDLQDVGVRCYTYISTMALAMQSSALYGKLFVVLDRPNPLGGIITQGPVLEPQYASFVGIYPIPLRHGMTVGELALMFNEAFGIGADLAVIRMRGWRRRLWFEDTGLQWVPPSPAIRSPETAFAYAGTCLFEGTNLSEGRGTSSPFRLIGAPWLDPEIISTVDEQWLAGFAVSPHQFTPNGSKHQGTKCIGFSIHMVDKEKGNPVHLSVALLAEIVARHRTEFVIRESFFDAIAGTDTLRHEICMAVGDKNKGLEKLFYNWQLQNQKFDKLRTQYLLYEG